MYNYRLMMFNAQRIEEKEKPDLNVIRVDYNYALKEKLEIVFVSDIGAEELVHMEMIFVYHVDVDDSFDLDKEIDDVIDEVKDAAIELIFLVNEIMDDEKPPVTC